MTQSTESAFYVDTALKLTGCTTDIEVIIKQVISAVAGKFGKSSVPVIHNRQNALCVLPDQTCKMEITFPILRIFSDFPDGNHHKTGYLSSLWKLSEIQVSQ